MPWSQDQHQELDRQLTAIYDHGAHVDAWGQWADPAIRHHGAQLADNRVWRDGVDQWGTEVQNWMGRVDEFGEEHQAWRSGVDAWGNEANEAIGVLHGRTAALRTHVNDARTEVATLARRLTRLERVAGLATRVPAWGYALTVAIGLLATLVWFAIDFSRTAEVAGEPVVVEYPVAENPLAALVVGLLVAIIVFLFIPRQTAPVPQNNGNAQQAQPAQGQQPAPQPANPAQPQPAQPVAAGPATP